MIGQTWPSEIRTFQDEKTGCTIHQLTQSGNNIHLYFTENSFVQGKNEIIFLSDRASGVEKLPHENPHTNLFRMDLDSGLITQLTDEPMGSDTDPNGGPVGSATKTPDGEIMVYITGNQIKKLDVVHGESSVIYTEPGNYNIGALSIAANRRYIAFCRNENVDVKRGPNYMGFKERFYQVKDGRITLAYLDRSGGFDVFKDTHQVGHFQFCPDDSTLGMYCHEGPWHLVTQRIWLLDFASREARPCFRQGEDDSVGHEFWTDDGYIFFDNRGPGHDGTITSDRTQAVAIDVAVKQQQNFVPFVGLADRKGNVVRRLDMPYYTNHYHANPDHTLLVGDDVDDLVLIDISRESASLQVLCSHKTSWHTSNTHCHPTWSWDGKKILFASDYTDGNPLHRRVNLYRVDR